MSTARARTLAAQGKKPQGSMRITIDGHEIAVDVLTLTIREKHLTGAELRRLGLPTDDAELMTAAGIWIIAKRSIPSLTLDDVLDNVTLGDLISTVEDDSPQA